MAQALPDITVDLLVAGSGAAGLSAAVTAAALGLQVLVAEKHTQFGGTTAWSGGWMWIPRNPLAEAAGIREDLDAPRTYLRHELGEHFDEARVEAFLAQAPQMVAFFQQHSALAFVDGNGIPDFHGDSPGAVTGGRSVCAAPFDGRRLGPHLKLLREPLDLVSPWGMGIASGPDLRHFMNALRSWASFRHVTRRVLTHWAQRMWHGRGTHLVNGNALVAGLMRSALDRGVALQAGCAVQRLLVQQGRVVGAVLRTPQGEQTVHARRGVVLACGGFPHDTARIAQLFAHAPTGTEHHSAAPPANTGDGLRLGEGVGAAVNTQLTAAGAWAPVSLVAQPGGSTGRFPHLIERAKPGLIAVTRRGQRFANEANSYYDVMSALFAATPAGEPAEAWLLCDHRFIRRYGLGHVRPSPMPIWPALRSGYLKRGRTLAELAHACGVDAAGLQATVATYNAAAAQGQDPAFGRGSTPYNRINGDAAFSPNPCVAPLVQAPYYAVKIVPGSLGTFAGLRTDAQARVLNESGAPIAGLWACGNDAASLMGGRYPSGGITLGPGMTFGYIAAHDAAQQPLGAPQHRTAS